MRRLFNLRIIVVALLVVSLAGWWQWHYSWKYPYGWSHCCDKQLMFALHNFAEDHGGAFPAGEATPEASLSLLYPKYADANLLRGKTAPDAVVQSTLDRGDRLGPGSSGWHYVEGLTVKDDPRLALFWDKVGLGHNGERADGHVVYFTNFDNKFIAEADWAKFLEEQQRLLNEREAAKVP